VKLQEQNKGSAAHIISESTKMKSLLPCLVVLLLVCIQLTSASRRGEQLSRLAALIARVRSGNQARAASDAYRRTVDDNFILDDDALMLTRRTGRGVAKRQGAWSYDYGLGGGRFGKRGSSIYGDYGVGGGRFGRDVDHVDPDMTS